MEFQTSFEPVFRHIDTLLGILPSALPSDPTLLRLAIDEMEAIMPSGGEPLSAQARSGLICLISACEMLMGSTQVNVVDPATATVDALDNYEFFTRRRIKNDTSSPTDYPLLHREIGRQLVDAEFIKRHQQLQKPHIVDYRLENLQYVIPIAV
jgi:hypothetical protein